MGSTPDRRSWQHSIMTKGVVLTTGANSGIGLRAAIEIAGRGYRSVGTVRSGEKADILRRAASEAGVNVEAVLLDVTDAAACAEMMGNFELYGLVNNAGYTNTGAVEDTADADVRHQFETMTMAPMRLARLALPAMRSNGTGRIVNVSSIYGRTTTPLTGWYQACKHALEAVSDALRVEVASSGVKVILVEPGGFRTGIWDDNRGALARHQGSRYTRAYERELLFTRLAQPFMGDPRQVARVIAHAISTRTPRARYLVGHDARILALIEQTTPTLVKDTFTRLGLGL
jgi:NAD(P)-dependent dehydrogenase (short-subunit alcohol dehydrogenase family)